jgi:hypothetical protein
MRVLEKLIHNMSVTESGNVPWELVTTLSQLHKRKKECTFRNKDEILLLVIDNLMPLAFVLQSIQKPCMKLRIAD